MTHTKRLSDLFECAYQQSDKVERAKFDSVMKDDISAPHIVLADLVFEIIQLTKKLDYLIERVDEIEESL